MRKTDKVTLWVVILVFTAALIAIFWDYVRYTAHKLTDGNDDGSKVPDLDTASIGTTTPTAASGTVSVSWTKTLKKGVYDSPEVKLLQKLLNQYQATNTIAEDGDFGPKTEAKLLSVTGKKEITLQQAYALLQNMFQ